ncbi:YbdD/YjiX family protein [Micrococcus sp. 2A]|uniref:YbdD/YjiX family protein n=1 Tax=unclassified Micrococcus TaxID=2620948 RepID=UPI002002AEAE|nr:YbdD/YjiX family protein [Micrococcus sp. EYE_212]MCK6170584.1 YbdD/YjiX family protein [Micrococcus sp. EYE_162]
MPGPHATTPDVASPAEAASGVGGRRGAWASARWWLRQLTGEGKYDAYLAHHRARHPDVDPMTEREFWRDEYAKQDANPGSRCC